MNATEKYQIAAKVLDEKKAENIACKEISGISSLGDYFVICEAGSTTHVKALSDYVEEALSKAGEKPLHTEGYQSANWILLDYGDVLVHIFLKESRAFYDLDRLWADAKPVSLEGIIS